MNGSVLTFDSLDVTVGTTRFNINVTANYE